jgi:hypothetical protein
MTTERLAATARRSFLDEPVDNFRGSPQIALDLARLRDSFRYGTILYALTAICFPRVLIRLVTHLRR